MDETGKKIRDLTEAMRAEQDARIRNRMMAVRGILETKDAALRRRGPAHGPAVGGAVRRGRHRWPPGRSRTRGVRADQETGRQACRQEHAHPEKAAKLDTGRLDARCYLRRILRFWVLVQICYHVSWRRCGKAVAGPQARYRGQKGADLRSWCRTSQYFSERGRTDKLWSRVGDPVTVSRHGRRDKTIVFGALAEDGTRLMRHYGKFDGPTFVRYLKEVRRKWGKVLLV